MDICQGNSNPPSILSGRAAPDRQQPRGRVAVRSPHPAEHDRQEQGHPEVPRRPLRLREDHGGQGGGVVSVLCAPRVTVYAGGIKMSISLDSSDSVLFRPCAATLLLASKGCHMLGTEWLSPY